MGSRTRLAIGAKHFFKSQKPATLGALIVIIVNIVVIIVIIVIIEILIIRIVLIVIIVTLGVRSTSRARKARTELELRLEPLMQASLELKLSFHVFGRFRVLGL